MFTDRYQSRKPSDAEGFPDWSSNVDHFFCIHSSIFSLFNFT